MSDPKAQRHIEAAEDLLAGAGLIIAVGFWIHFLGGLVGVWPWPL